MNLAEQIAREHPIHVDYPPHHRCVCGHDFHGMVSWQVYAAHIATVTERAVRERAKAQIEALPAESGATGEGAWSLGYTSGVSDAARIVEGGTDE